FRYAARAYGNVAGLIAFAAFGFNLLSPRLATFVRSDMPLALVIFLIGLLIWEKIRTGGPWRRQDRWIMFGLLTAGMLIKGPIVYAFLLPGLIVYQLRKPKTDSAGAWCGWWPWLGSFVVFLIWVIAGWLWVPRFYELVIVREFLARFGEVGTHVHRAQSFFFYLPHLLHKFFPWSAVLVGLAIADLRARKLDRLKRPSLENGSATEKISPETFWLICWSIGGVILLLIISSQRDHRNFSRHA